MYRRLIYGTCIAAILSLGGTIQAAVFNDSFDTAHDYLAAGVEGTGWDGFIGRGPNETVASLNASGDRPGQLYIASANAFYQEPWSPLGPFLYKMVQGDFIATVKVSDYAGTAAAPVYHNNCGLMARALPEDAGPGEDWVALDYFPIWNCGNFVRSADDDVRTENGHNGRAWNLYPWLQVERKGNTFSFRTSSDGVTWTEMGASPLVRDDLADIPLQVGLYQATYSADLGYAGFDDFRVEGPFVVPPNKAYNPVPGGGVTDVPRGTGTMLSWTPATTAVAHDVYFGTDADAIVLVGQRQDANAYDAGLLTYGRTYYWRVDEVRADGTTIDQGVLWSFTIEPYGYPIKTVTAAASSSSSKNTGPEKTVDGSGLNANDEHSTDSKAMWLSSRTGAQPTWIQYAFDKPYKLHQMWVWNSNQVVEADLGYGAKDVTIQYSTDAATWTTLGDFEFAQAPGEDGYAANTKLDLGGAVAKYVKLTISSNWGEVMPQYGLSEVRFFYVPVAAREPKPAADATDLHPQVALSWRPGRQAAAHDVYLSTDQQAVTDGTAAAVRVSEPSYDVAVNLAQKYFWKVTEVNEAETPTAWPGEVWSFSTAEYIVVDDFEGYTNDSPLRVFQTWIDGEGFSADEFFPNGNPGNGSGALVGYDPTAGSIMETSLVHSGRQSMPLYYDNSGGGNSEAERTFAAPQDWTKHGITTLVIWFRGDVNNVSAPLYVKINGTKIQYNNGAAVTALPVWKQWNINLASVSGLNLKSVKTLAIGVGNGSSSGSGTIFIDDILLYATAPQPPAAAADPGTKGLVLLYSMEGNVQDSSGKGNHGTTSGDPGYLQGPPGMGKALLFDGTNDYVIVPIGTLLTTLTSSTFTAWVNCPDAGTWSRVFDFGIPGEGAANPGVYMFLTSNTGRGPRFAITTTGGGGEQIVESPFELGAGWHHLAVVIDATGMTLRLYQDGSLVGSSATTLLPKDLGNTTQNWLGRSEYTVDPFFNGLLDDFRIYSRALSESEVRYLAGDR